MNDRNALFELCESPGFLLQELGIGEEVFVYRPYGREDRSGFVKCEALDDDIAHRGKGFLVRNTGSHLAIIRLVDPYGRFYKLLSLEFDYTCPGGRRYWFCLQEEEEKERVLWCGTENLLDAELLPVRECDHMIPLP